MHSSSTFIKCAASFTHDTDVQYRPSEENKYIKFKISKFLYFWKKSLFLTKAAFYLIKNTVFRLQCHMILQKSF